MGGGFMGGVGVLTWFSGAEILNAPLCRTMHYFSLPPLEMAADQSSRFVPPAK